MFRKIGKGICQAWCWVFAAFDAKAQGGLSMRKVVAVWCMVLVHKNHNKYLNAQANEVSHNTSIGDFSLLTTMTLYDYIMIGIALGMILVPELIKGVSIFFNRTTTPDSQKTQTTITSEQKQ